MKSKLYKIIYATATTANEYEVNGFEKAMELCATIRKKLRNYKIDYKLLIKKA